MSRQRAQALVELALVTPLLALLALGLVGLARLQIVRTEVDEVARETAREATLQPLPASPNDTQSAADAAAKATEYGRSVARGYHLDIQPDVTFAPSYGRGNLAHASASLKVSVGDLLPLGGLAAGGTPSVTLTGEDFERIDKYRSVVP